MDNKYILGLVVGLVVFMNTVTAHDYEDDDGEDYKIVTCGSSFRLKHANTGYYVSSGAITWGSGSGQQAVTASNADADAGAIWSIMEGFGETPCTAGEPIACGSTIRFLHANSHHFLHSHSFNSPLSGLQEVSGFPEANSSALDNWTVECPDTSSTDPSSIYWRRNRAVSLLHSSTQKYLYSNSKHGFNQQNCRNCPIVGHLEVSGAPPRPTTAEDTKFYADSGVYFPIDQDILNNLRSNDETPNHHDEL